ncbi:MAG: exosortase-associated EpsI family protein, partial [Kiritimatiellae bacterium]|nr:exosortase-associated EpsI family protein [Kiritimatiellia bacterium]
LVPALFSAAVAAAMAVQSTTPDVTVADPPDVHLSEIAGCESSPLEPSEAELKVLPSDTRIEKQLYTCADGEWFQVSVVVGGTSKSSIHRPELCLPAQGFQMTSPRTVEVCGVDWRFLTLEARGERPLGFAYTFFNQEGFRTASHVRRIVRDVWDRSVRNRIDRWVMVTVCSSRAGDMALGEIAGALKGVAE